MFVGCDSEAVEAAVVAALGATGVSVSRIPGCNQWRGPRPPAWSLPLWFPAIDWAQIGDGVILWVADTASAREAIIAAMIFGVMSEIRGDADTSLVLGYYGFAGGTSACPLSGCSAAPLRLPEILTAVAHRSCQRRVSAHADLGDLYMAFSWQLIHELKNGAAGFLRREFHDNNQDLFQRIVGGLKEDFLDLGILDAAALCSDTLSVCETWDQVEVTALSERWCHFYDGECNGARGRLEKMLQIAVDSEDHPSTCATEEPPQ